MNDFQHIREQAIGTVEYVSPREIKVLLDISAPQNTAINTGTPQLFPKVNGFVLIPNEAGALVCIISWVGVEYSKYPKRKGYQDFNLIDLPFPLRKLSINPLGNLKENNGKYEVERGVFSFPSVGDTVVVPDQLQLQAIVQNKDEKAKVKIGKSPMAANAPVYVNPDKIFGRHIAVLGNTGSGKSCSVAGLIRWSLDAVNQELEHDQKPNSRFIVLDPNGEYSKTFDDMNDSVKKFQVKFDEHSDNSVNQLKVPSWMWNSFEWSSIAQATQRTQRPILRRALRDVRSGEIDTDDKILNLRRHYSSCLIEVRNDLVKGASAFKGKPGKNDFGKKVESIKCDSQEDQLKIGDDNSEIKDALKHLSDGLEKIVKSKYNTFETDEGETIEYYNDFEKSQVEEAISLLDRFLSHVGGLQMYEGPNEDHPVFFNNEDFLNHLDRLARENNVQQYLDFFIMRIRSILTDARISSVIETSSRTEVTLEEWLNDYIGKNEEPSINVIDLSLVPSEILYIVVSVLTRIIFEALQRYRKQTTKVLPTTLVVEEAHNFIKRYNTGNDEVSASKLCTQSFEKVAKEGRKFGLGLVISSQRPFELSQTVLSQCNTFLLHRLVNDKDQEMVKKLVPDNMGGILNELPILPTRKAVLLGWAAPIPTLVEMNYLEEDQRPKSADPDFWDVWTRKEERNIDWATITKEWQNQNPEDNLEGDD